MIKREYLGGVFLDYLFHEMEHGMIIKIDESSKESMEEARAYFPDWMERMFSAEELIAIIKWCMGFMHKQISEAGEGEILMISAIKAHITVYGMLRHVCSR